MTTNQKAGNQSGCKEQTRNVDEGIGNILEDFEGYICDKLCFCNHIQMTQEERDQYCNTCQMHGKVSEIEAEYEEINDFSKSSAYQMMEKYRKFVFCKKCKYSDTAGKPGTYLCRLETGLLEVLKRNDGCSLGEEE